MRGPWKCRVFALLGVVLGLGLTWVLFRDLVRWPSDWLLFLEQSKQPPQAGAGPWGLALFRLLGLPLLSAEGARSLLLLFFGGGWILVFLLAPLREWRVWEALLWGLFAGGSLLIAPQGPAILGNQNLLLPLVFLPPLVLMALHRGRKPSSGGILAGSLLGGLGAGLVSLFFLGVHFPWGETLLLFSLVWAWHSGWGAWVAGGVFLVFTLGLGKVLSWSPVLDPRASLVDLLGAAPAWSGLLWQLFSAGLGLRFLLKKGDRLLPVLRVPLHGGLLLLLILGFGNVARWKKVSAQLEKEREALSSSLSKIPSLGRVLVWNLPSFLRAEFAVQTLGSSAQFLLVQTWDLGGEVHIPESWNDYETTPVLRWTPEGMVATRFEELLLLPPFPLVWTGSFARTPFAMIRMRKSGGNGFSGERVEVDWKESEARVRLLGTGESAPFALALLAGKREVFVPSKHVLGSLSGSWFSPPFPRFGIQGKGVELLSRVLPGIGPWVQTKNPQAAFRVRVLRR